MTEYDYSPAAYERYLRTQNRVSNWVSHTKAHERQYSNPFVASILGSPAFSAQSLPQQQNLEAKRSKSNGSSSAGAALGTKVRASRDPAAGAGPQRSKTLDSKQTRSINNPGADRPSRSRSFTTKADDYTKPRSRSHHSHTRSQLQPQPPLQPQYPQPQYHYTPPRTPPHPTPIRSGAAPQHGQQFMSNNGQPIYIPRARPGETYVIIPPGGDRRVEYQYVSSGMKGGATGLYPNSPPRGGPGGSALTRGHPYVKEPLLKRLWGGLTRGSSNAATRGVDSRGRRSTF